MKAVSVAPDERLSALAGAPAAWTYAAQVPATARADALTWARACFEGAPLPMRLFLVVGWRGLLLEGGPRSGPDRVLGWPVARDAPDLVVLQRRSLLGISATLVFAAGPDIVTFSSAMVFTSRLGRIVWAGVAPLHRWAVRVVLSHATTVVAP